MAFIPFNDVIKLEAIFTQAGQTVVNVHHYRGDATPDVALMEELAELYATWWESNMSLQVASNVQLTKIRCTILETENSPGIESVAGLPAVGVKASPALPNSVTIAVRWLTALRGRSYRGRTYHVGLCEDQIDGNAILGPAHTALLSAYDQIRTFQTQVGPCILGVASRQTNNAPRATGVFTPVESVAIESYVDSQRRRLPGRGR